MVSMLQIVYQSNSVCNCRQQRVVSESSRFVYLCIYHINSSSTQPQHPQLHL